jgi:threonine synthase
MSIRYYSTNRNLDPSAGRIPYKGTVSFKEALLKGQAPDEGLFMPVAIPSLDIDEIMALKGAPYKAAAALVAGAFLSDDIDAPVLEGVVADAYNFPVPIEKVTERLYLLRLDQGPTASFKDFAARMMARLMSYFRASGKRLNVLVATSGDTGSAVGEAYKGLSGIDVHILYPRTEVSDMQKKQLDTIGANVRAISIDGKFDDCQNLVKQAFSDPDLEKFNLTSANSINFGRILPQIVYYVYCYAQLAGRGEDIVFCVPSGNFGDALGCEFARRMGLPVKKLIMPTNANDEFPRFLETGVYEKISPSRAAISNAMNVGNPSNLARFFDLYGGTVDRLGIVHRMPDLAEMRRRIYSVSVGDDETRETIKRVFQDHGVILEPHGAVGWHGLTSYLAASGDPAACVCLETAHPAKFPEEIEALLGFMPDLPQSMAGLAQKTGEPFLLSTDYRTFKHFLQDHLKIDD